MNDAHKQFARAREELDVPAATGNHTGVRHMLEHQLLLPEGVLVLEPLAPLEAADFDELVRQTDPYIAKHGSLSGLMIHAKAFPGWANLDAFLAHMHFVKSHYRRIGRLAMVTDSKLLEELPRIAGHLAHVQVKHFSESQYGEALSWLKARTPVSADLQMAARQPEECRTAAPAE